VFQMATKWGKFSALKEIVEANKGRTRLRQGYGCAAGESATE